MPSLTTWAPFCAMVLPMWTMLSPWSKQSHGCSCQGCKATNHIGTLRNLPNPNTHQNSPEPSGTCLWNLHQHTPEPSGTFRNHPEPISGTYTSIRRNPPEPSGTRLRNLTAHTGALRNLPEPASGTYTAHTGALRNLPEPASGTYTAHTPALRNLPEPSSGTCSCDPHRRTPELIWAEDPISLGCWGKTQRQTGIKLNERERKTSRHFWLLTIKLITETRLRLNLLLLLGFTHALPSAWWARKVRP